MVDPDGHAACRLLADECADASARSQLAALRSAAAAADAAVRAAVRAAERADAAADAALARATEPCRLGDPDDCASWRHSRTAEANLARAAARTAWSIVSAVARNAAQAHRAIAQAERAQAAAKRRAGQGAATKGMGSTGGLRYPLVGDTAWRPHPANAGIGSIAESDARAAREWHWQKGREWELEVRSRVAPSVNPTKYDLVYDRTIKDPSTRLSVDLKRPDVQVVDRSTRLPVKIIDAKSSSTAEGLAAMEREAIAKYTASSAKLPGGPVPVEVAGRIHAPYRPWAETAAGSLGGAFLFVTVVDLLVNGPPTFPTSVPLPCYNPDCVY